VFHEDIGADIAEEINAVNQFHGEKPLVVLGNELVELGQIGVFDICQGAELMFEPQEAVPGDRIQGFKRQTAPALLFDDLIHGPHSATAYLANQLESGGAFKLHGVAFVGDGSRAE